MNNRIEIDLGFAKLVVERGSDTKYNEVFVGLKDSTGVWAQLIAVIRNAHDVDDHWNVIQKEKIEVLTSSDENYEDYTHRFEINPYKEVEVLL